MAQARNEKGTLIASGFIAGGALMGVVSALIKFCGVECYLGTWAASNGAALVGVAFALFGSQVEDISNI